jgi:thiamine pyrophosphokinase
MKGVVLLGGAVRATQRLRRAAQGGDWVIAADGGLRHAERLGVAAALLVGDLDSLSAAERARFRGALERYPTDKDALDLELALDAAQARGARGLLLIGGLTGRLDQTLATIAVAQGRHAAGFDVAVDDGVRRVWPLRPGETRTLPLAPRERFSLQALSDDAIVSVAGGRYPLQGAHLARAEGRGVSNEALGAVTVTLHAGALVAIAPGGRAARRPAGGHGNA